MRVRSLGCRTDLMLIAWDGVVDEADGVLRARSPDNPQYFFGNFLLFPDPPRSGDVPLWIERFASAFADDPRIQHVCLRWDCPEGARGAAEEFSAEGFAIEEMIVLETSAPRPPPRTHGEAELRRIESERDWTAVTALQVAVMTEQHGPRAEAFARKQMARYHRFVARGLGAWFGAFVGEELVADMGVFVQDGLARFQAVETAPAFRRRGMCGALVHYAARTALDEMRAESLVIVGLPDHTSQLYASVGFLPRERLIAVVRRGKPLSHFLPT